MKRIKPRVVQGRPEEVLAEVGARGQTQPGLRYPSGHVAVAATLAAIVLTATRPVRLATSIAVGVLFGWAADEMMERWP